MRSLSIMLVAILVAAKAAEARASRLFNIYFLEEGQYLNPAWYGDSAFGVEEQVTETPIIPTGRRRRFGEKKVETVSMMKKPQVQDKTKRKKGVVVGKPAEPKQRGWFFGMGHANGIEGIHDFE